MPRTIRLPVSALLGLACLAPIGFAVSPGQGGQDQVQPLRVGFVDLHTVLEADPALRQSLDAVRQEMKRYEEIEVPKMKEELQRLAADMAPLVEDSWEYAVAQAELQGKNESFKFAEKAKVAFLQRQANLANVEAAERARAAVAELARRRGIDVVARIRTPKSDELRDRMEAIEYSDFLYSSDKLDLTKDVIEFMKTR